MTDIPRVKLNYKLRITDRTPGRMNIPIDGKVFQFMLEHRDSYLQSYNSRYPWCALLGTDEFDCVRMLVKLYPTGGGCYNMPDISTNVFVDTAMKLATRGFKLSGLVRIGKFNLVTESSRGPSMQELGKMAPSFFVVSLGVGGMCIETWRGGRSGHLIKHGWFTVKGGEYHGSEQDKDSCRQGHGSGDVPPHDKGGVRGAGVSDDLRRAEQSNDSAGVSEQKANELRLIGSSEQADSGSGLCSKESRYSHEDREGKRRKLEIQGVPVIDERALLESRLREEEKRRDAELKLSEARAKAAEEHRILKETEAAEQAKTEEMFWNRFRDVLM